MIRGALLLVATPTPTTSSTPKVDADLVTPGLWGFVLLFFLALAVYFLGRSMARRVRRVNQRARVEAELQEAALADQGPGEAVGQGRGGEHERLDTSPAAADEDPPAPR